MQGIKPGPVNDMVILSARLKERKLVEGIRYTLLFILHTHTHTHTHTQRTHPLTHLHTQRSTYLLKCTRNYKYICMYHHPHLCTHLLTSMDMDTHTPSFIQATHKHTHSHMHKTHLVTYMRVCLHTYFCKCFLFMT